MKVSIDGPASVSRTTKTRDEEIRIGEMELDIMVEMRRNILI